MNKTKLGLALGLAFALPAAAQSPGKVGVINIQSAIAGTKDGQKAGNEIQARFTPKKTDLEKRQSDISQLQEQLNRGANTLSEEARNQLTREIEQKTKTLNRDTEDARAELDQEEQKIMSELGGRIMAVIDKYAKDHGYTLVLDISSQQTPVLFASNTIDITKDIIELYDKNAPAPAAAGPAPGKPAVPAPKSTPPK
ncbi:MAG: OmpH family outer membrane protein [Acidobacteriia bacterium]|nr:OmpH family outer membrane protein [Terriglobia bacterium]